MKKTNLCLAILVAAGLTACGSGSDGDSATTPGGSKSTPSKKVADGGGSDKAKKKAAQDAAKKKADAAKKKAEKMAKKAADSAAKESIDPTGTDEARAVAISEGTDKIPSVGAQQYLRNGASRFDRNLNPDKQANATAHDTVTLNEQNPDLTNIVVGRKYIHRKDGRALIRRFAGENTYLEKDSNKNPTLQAENTKNVDLDAGFSDNPKNNGLFYAVVKRGYKAGVVGLEKDQTTTTRYFGHKHLKEDGSEVENTYLSDWSYKKGGKTQLSAIKSKLLHVQYGRVSNNIDPVPNAVKKVPGDVFKAAYRKRGDIDAVNTYFYRGTGETTLAQMNALPKTGYFKYTGHALTYGLKHGSMIGEDSPNAFAPSEAEVLGSFVRADLDLKDRTVKGYIYDTWVMNNKARQNRLVNFDAAVVGNSFVGGAKRLDTNAVGTVKGSFYGKEALEMGGAVNSVKKGYGDKAWGAVFGAQRNDNAPAIDDKHKVYHVGGGSSW